MTETLPLFIYNTALPISVCMMPLCHPLLFTLVMVFKGSLYGLDEAERGRRDESAPQETS